MITGFSSRSTAPTWDAGIIAGTGSAGAVLHGGPARHLVDISHEEFFGELNDRPPAPVMTDVLPEVRSRLLAGDAAGAAALADEVVAASDVGDRLVWTDPLLPAARLAWEPSGRGPENTDTYRRAVDFLSGEASAHWATAAGVHRIAVLPVRAADVFVVELRAPGPVDGVLTLCLNRETAVGGPGSRGAAYAARVRARASSDRGRLHLLTSPRGDFADVVAQTVVVAGPGVEMVVEHVGEGEVRARVSAGTGVATLAVAVDVQLGDGAFDASATERRCRSVLGEPAAARAAQLRDHGGLVGRTSFRVGGGEPTPELEALAAAVRRDEEGAHRLAVELAFAAGRHTILSSTGVLPPTLQGVWQGTWSPAWSSDYTMNGNVQNGAAAGAVVAGFEEVVPAIFRLLSRFRHDFEDNARRVYGLGGWLLPARCTTHGRADHTNHRYPHHWWIGNGPWMVRMGFDYWSATGDDHFLRDVLWPLTVNVLEFSCDVVVPGADGRAHVVPSYSPENTPAGAATPLAVDATSDVAMLRDAARLGRRIAALVPGADPGLDARWAALERSLPGYRISDGALAEWIGDGFEDHVPHRHASHLYPFWYEDEAGVGTAERLAALEAIRRRLDWRAEDPSGPPGRMEMAFGLVQLGVAAARLGSAEMALRCATWLAELHWGTNGVSTHDAGAIFNVDASGGLPAVVTAMLLEAQPNVVTVLQACPDAWPEGEITGLRGRGGLVADRLAWTPDAVELEARFAPGTERTRDGDLVEIRVGGAGRRTVTAQLAEAPTLLRLPRCP
ncbi:MULTISPECIES: glycoside hydrolase N-terminal domain-containing protein [unclassified Actinotalea]|uniref:glycosyl hydrolase family 95 catalytic domain-containing protein n=1 Tax=unclassified Actinotalea TaxID=2638618 RepID=UPI0015F631F6|nr:MULTISPECIES: glycoside hydrolase N-terminal domain-containing protein [unclassified Actinotalea]